MVNYPKGTAKTGKNPVKTARKRKKSILKVAPGNRGMGFENEINLSNQYYLDKGICLITKRPTPISVVKVDYARGAKITEAFFKTQSTTDYNGVYKGHYIDFEAKSTHSKTSFPLSNIPVQQIEHLTHVLEYGGIAFFLIHFYGLEETYLLSAKVVIDFYKERPRASLPLDLIKEKGKLVPVGYQPPYDYLPLVEELFLK